jgi:hypothetical protein
MWDVLTALIAAVAPLIIPLLIIWLVVTHWQQLSAAINDLANIPAIIIGQTAAALTNEGLIFVGGLAVISILGFLVIRKVEPKAPTPVFAAIGPQGYGPIAGAAARAPAYAPYQFATPSTYTSGFPTARLSYSSRAPLPVPSRSRRRSSG